ncbi:prophage tail fiber N-terminal domain-containing protein, partial [Escherichia coli]|uniref:prophage tail fiber N-terminal domain-containing protein n=4 Tax=Escherichia coli TaxID=562 RepID=UPI000CFE3303
MAVKISGVLKDGTGKPVQNCTIQLKAKRNSTTVVVNTLASENPDEAGRYSMDVEYGQYSVILLVEGFPPSHAGTITVYEDSRPGTLNDFLGAMTEDDARPEALRRFELMVDTVARQAAETAGNAQKAGKYAEDAGQVLARVGSLAGEVQGHAVSVAESERDIRQLAEAVSQRAGEAERAAEETRENTAQAGQYAQTAQQNAGQTARDLQEVTEARDAAVQARRGAESALTAVTRQAETAAQQAKSAGDAAAVARAQAEASAAARNEAVSARDETAGLARDVEAAIPQVNQWLTTATGAAERAEEAVTAAAESAGQAAAGAESAMKAREATETLTRRAETAAGRAEEIAGAFNLENASQEKKGIVRLSNATDSESETEAATPLAVKTVMEETQKKAALDSPAFTGTPTTPTPPDDASGPEMVNAAFVRKRLADLVSSSPEALDTLNELAAALGNDPAFSATVMNMLAGKQPLNRVLTALSRFSPEENSFPCFTGDGQCSSAPVSEKGKLLLSQSTAEEMRDVLGISGAGGDYALQSDIYDRTPGRAAIAGSLGFGHIFREDEFIHFPSKAALLEWVTNATPGRYGVYSDGSEIMPGMGSGGVIDLFFA